MQRKEHSFRSEASPIWIKDEYFYLLEDHWCYCDQRQRRSISHEINCSSLPIYLAEEILNPSERFPGVVKTNSSRLLKLVCCVSCQAFCERLVACMALVWTGQCEQFQGEFLGHLSVRMTEEKEMRPHQSRLVDCVYRGATYVKWQLVTPSASTLPPPHS